MRVCNGALKSRGCEEFNDVKKEGKGECFRVIWQFEVFVMEEKMKSLEKKKENPRG